MIYIFVQIVDLKQEIIMKDVKIGWPEIQDYMNNPDYPEECYFDPSKNCWFIPDTWEPDDLGLIGW
mgnify:CR=1 FL=1